MYSHSLSYEIFGGRFLVGALPTTKTSQVIGWRLKEVSVDRTGDCDFGPFIQIRHVFIAETIPVNEVASGEKIGGS